MREPITIWSEGTRMAGDLFIPDDFEEGQRRAAILLCHGWGGPKEHLSTTYAPLFCAAGFVCLTFDYRGWFESDARLEPRAPLPAPNEDGTITVTARPVREMVDPLDQNRDIHNAFDFLLGEPSVDPDRVGLWGSSYGGGHVVYLAGIDPRVKAVVSQVPGMGHLVDEKGFPEVEPGAQEVATGMARGELDAVPRPPDFPEALVGTGDVRTMWRYLPRVAAANIRAPILIIDQEEEEYGGRENSGFSAFSALPEGTVSKYHVFPGTHYEIYSTNFRASAEMARDWFLAHL